MSQFDASGISLASGCLHLESRYLAATRQSEALRTVIKNTEHELEHEYRAHEGQLSNAREKSSQEILRLKQELNRIRVSVDRKTKEVERLKEICEYPALPSLFSSEEISESPPIDSLEPLSLQLQSSLQSASERIIREDQTTEMLKQMLEKATKAELIMKQRTREVMIVCERVNQQLMDVKRMRHIAANYLTLTSNQKARLKDEMEIARESFLSHFHEKAHRLDVMSGSSKRLIEKIGTHIFTHTEVNRQKAAIMQCLEGEVKRFSGERGVVRKAEEDLKMYSRAFGVVERVMRNAGCDVHCSRGITPETARQIIHQFNVMIVFEGSLASSYNGLTWEYSEKEAQLTALRQDYESLLRLLPADVSTDNIQPPKLFEGSLSADTLEQTSLQLYAGIISLLNMLQTVHTRVSECLSIVSPSIPTWSILKTVTKGFRLKKKEFTFFPAVSNDAGFITRHRHMTSFPVRSHTERDLEQLPREVNHKETSQYQPLSQDEISKAITDSASTISNIEKAGVLTAFSKLSIVKYFADATMLKDILRTVKQKGRVIEFLIEKSQAAMRSGFKELISYAKDAILCFAKEEREGKEIVSGYSRRRSLSSRLSSEGQLGEIEERIEIEKAEKDLVRGRFAALCPHATDSSTETESRKPVEAHSSKRSSLIDAPLELFSAPPPLDIEALEAQYIVRTRLQLKCSSGQQSSLPPAKRLISSSVGRLRRLRDTDDKPSTERAKTLLKGFLDTERKIMVVKCAERVTLKSQSARNTPTVKKYHRFQAGSPFKAKTAKMDVRKKLIRSQTMLEGERLGRLGGI